MTIHARSFAIGLLCAMALMGCMMAVTNVNASAGARYEVHWQPSDAFSARYVVLDTQTGTTVTWNPDPTGEVRAFNPAP